MKSLSALILAIPFVISCSATSPGHEGAVQRTEFQLGARDFQNGDNIIIEEVLSSSDGFDEGSLIIVRGSYDLRERGSAILYLGATNATGPGLNPTDPGQTQVVPQGKGRFELLNTMPGPGYPHVTFYDEASGSPFGGVYFGRGETLLKEKSWSYAR